MRVLSPARFYLASATFSIGLALCSGFYGIALLIASLAPHGSVGGNLILGFVGVFFLLASPVMLFCGNAARKKAKSN
jgi:hypothetical protein